MSQSREDLDVDVQFLREVLAPMADGRRALKKPKVEGGASGSVGAEALDARSPIVQSLPLARSTS